MAKSVSIILLFLQASLCCCGQEKSVVNSIGMQFVLIEPGSMIVGEFQPPYPVPDDTIKTKEQSYIMWMGDGRGYNEAEFALAKKLATKDATHGILVKINNPYYIGKFEVTQAQWQHVMKRNPSTFQGNKFPNADSLPVENVTWDDVQRFITELNKLEKTKKYRLPTEFEWEYAARAGVKNDIPWNMIQRQAQLAMLSTQKIGGKEPNGWGLYDMLGNVWEWVHDYYNEKIFADSVPPQTGTQHVLKGASFAGDVKNATYMTHAAGPGNGWDVGFRLVMEVQ